MSRDATLSVEDISKRLDALQAEIDLIKQERNNPRYDLLARGRESGSSGVLGAFVLIGFIFLINAIFFYVKDKELFSPTHLIILSAIVAFALLAYFGGIFGYEIWAQIKVKDKGIGAGSKPT